MEHSQNVLILATSYSIQQKSTSMMDAILISKQVQLYRLFRKPTSDTDPHSAACDVCPSLPPLKLATNT